MTPRPLSVFTVLVEDVIVIKMQIITAYVMAIRERARLREAMIYANSIISFMTNNMTMQISMKKAEIRGN